MGTVKGMQARLAEHHPAGLWFARSISSLTGMLGAAYEAHTTSGRPCVVRGSPTV